MATHTFAIYANTCRASMNAHGEIAAFIAAKPAPAFVGSAPGAVAYLKAIGMGRSVEVRRYDDAGQWRGTRSCMNKPALWADIAGQGA